MPWRQYTFLLDENVRERYEDALVDAGACSVTLQAANDEPLFELAPEDRPVWQAVKLTALTDFDIDPDSFLQTAASLLGHSIQAESSEVIADQDWTRSWMDHFKPIPCGNRLWIVPSWLPIPDSDATNLILDPGLAFGSGTHPTTHMCLEWLDKHISGNETVIDYGCGSGILAIAALLLGAENAIATDIDPQAIIATNDNADRNGIDNHRLQSFVCDEQALPKTAHVVVANILANPLIELAQTIGGLLSPTSKLVLSGILEDQAQAVITAYQPYAKLSVSAQRDGWVLLTNIV